MLGEKILVRKINYAPLEFSNSFNFFNYYLHTIFIFTDNYFEWLLEKGYNDIIMKYEERNYNIMIIKNDTLKK